MLTFTSKIYNEEKQIYFLRVSIQKLIKYMQTEKQNAKDGYEFHKIYAEKITRILQGLIESSNIKYSLIAVDIVKYFSIHTTELEKIYNQVVEEEKRTGVNVGSEEFAYYSTNIEENKFKVVKQCVGTVRNELDSLNIYSDKSILVILSQKSKKERDSVLDEIEQKFGKDARVDMQERIRIFRTPEVDLLKEKIQKTARSYEKILKEKYTESLLFIGNFLMDFDLLKNYANSENNNLSEIGLSELACSEQELINMFSVDYLMGLTVEQLSYLNVFWINKFAKEMENISKAGFVLTDFDLWPDIFEGKRVYFSDAELKYELLKIDTLENFEIDCMDEKPDNEVLKKAIRVATANEDSLQQILDGGSIKLDFSEYIAETAQKHGDDYHNRYAWKLPRSECRFKKEIVYFKDAYNTIQNAYKLKDIALTGILHNLELNDRIVNWGVIRQSEDDNIVGRKNLLIGIDLVGMNMPMRFHDPNGIILENVQDNKSGNAGFIPIYAGNDDYKFEYSNQRTKKDWMTSPILIPVSEEKKKTMEGKISNISGESNANLLHHLAYIYGIESFPEHLQETVYVKKKGKKIEKHKFVRQYINLITGEIIDENELEARKKSLKGDESR